MTKDKTWTFRTFNPSDIDIKVRAVKYLCGCIEQSDEPKPITSFPSKCLVHYQNIEGFKE